MFVVIGCLDLSWSFHETSDSRDGEASFPKSFSVFSKGSNDRIDHDTLREGCELAIPWVELWDLDDADLKRDTDLWSSKPQTVPSDHRILQVFDD